jgi:hypothetical protein
MGYSVRLLTPSEVQVPFSTILVQVNSLKLVSGSEHAWDKIEISGPEGDVISLLERYTLAGGGPAEDEMNSVKEALQEGFPLNAREWVRKYLTGTRVIYAFRLQAEQITPRGWPVLGRVQNTLKDRLSGIIQADQEGFYNEEGDYILWQMYDGATGTIPAAALNEQGEWTSYQLRLNEPQAVEDFKNGVVPPKSFLDRLWRR